MAYVAVFITYFSSANSHVVTNKFVTTRALTKFFWHLFKSEHVRLVQYRARKQAADLSDGRLLTRAVLYQRPNVACFDLWETFKNLVNVVISDKHMDGPCQTRS